MGVGYDTTGFIKSQASYASGYENIPIEAQARAKKLCWEYNRTPPDEKERRSAILQDLLGTYSAMVSIEPDSIVTTASISISTDLRF